MVVINVDVYMLSVMKVAGLDLIEGEVQIGVVQDAPEGFV